MTKRYSAVRAATRRLCEPLSTEDYVVQSMPDVSPTKWHLAHTTWFFETFLLLELGEEPYDPSFQYLFNSYYNAVGQQFPRARRGLMTRPTVHEIWRYRQHVDRAVERHLERGLDSAHLRIIEIGCQHEQQHQELMFTDIKHVLSQNKCAPRYGGVEPTSLSVGPQAAAPPRMIEYEGGLQEIGHDGAGFCFDNEQPAHSVYLQPFALASRLVTVAEYRAFIADGGYLRPELWLSEGWIFRQQGDLSAPLYWRDNDMVFTLAGERPLLDHEPVVHVSLYEADAYARWAGMRLPREQELELATAGVDVEGNFVERGVLHPSAVADKAGMQQLFGDAWEWTQSAYTAYPGYRAPEGALGEYNGKFMCNQHVLRGGSCVTPREHMRATYRNFFPASARWQFSSIRLCGDV